MEYLIQNNEKYINTKRYWHVSGYGNHIFYNPLWLVLLINLRDGLIAVQLQRIHVGSWHPKSPAINRFLQPLGQANTIGKHQISTSLAICDGNPPVTETKDQWCGMLLCLDVLMKPRTTVTFVGPISQPVHGLITETCIYWICSNSVSNCPTMPQWYALFIIIQKSSARIFYKIP